MTATEVHQKFKGVFGFPITPLKKDLSLDLDALASLCSSMSKHAFCAMVAAGGTGEIYSLTTQEVADVVRVTKENANGLPVVAGTGYNSVLGAEIARAAAKAGADCLLVLPPYYINAPESGLFDYYEAIGKATDLPLMVYSRDWAVFTPEMVERLADRVPTLAAWKDGQADAKKYQRIMNHCGDRLAWLGGQGDDCVPAYFAIGVQAYTSSISNIAPKVSLALADAGMKRDFATIDCLMKKYVHPLYALRERQRGYEVSVMKEAMEMLGIKAGPARPPIPPVREQDKQALRKILDAYSDML